MHHFLATWTWNQTQVSKLQGGEEGCAGWDFVPYVRMQIKDFPSVQWSTIPRTAPDQAGEAAGVWRVCIRCDPATPGLQFGRVCVDVSRRDVLVCCLCGGSANAMDLGDLHGPYYPEGFKSSKAVVIHRKRIIVTRTRLLEGNVLLQADGLSLFGPAIASCPIVLPLRDLG